MSNQIKKHEIAQRNTRARIRAKRRHNIEKIKFKYNKLNSDLIHADIETLKKDVKDHDTGYEWCRECIMDALPRCPFHPNTKKISEWENTKKKLKLARNSHNGDEKLV